MRKNKLIGVSLLFVVLVVAAFLVFFLRGENPEIVDEGNESIILVQDITQMPNPSSGYCHTLGYKSRIAENDAGQYGICIFPDGSECEEWAFYRGKCGQEWSYCARKGYDLKNLTDDEGWSYDGSICINKSTEEEVGNVYTLVNQAWADQNKNSLILVQDITQMPNPSSGYCHTLGYSYRINETEKGQQGICIFPDKSECDEWAFYRGKCGQEWSYCARKGYDLKNLTDDEGWSYDGSICINKSTKEEIGNVYTLVNQAWAEQNKI